MLSKKSTVSFHGTEEQEKALLAVIEELKDEKGALMPISPWISPKIQWRSSFFRSVSEGLH